MYLVAIGWLYVVLMVALAEALSKDGSVLNAVLMFLFFGLLPVALIVYVMGSPLRRRRRALDEAAQDAARSGQAVSEAGQGASRAVDPAPAAATSAAASAPQDDAGGHAPGASAAGTVRKEV